MCYLDIKDLLLVRPSANNVMWGETKDVREPQRKGGNDKSHFSLPPSLLYNWIFTIFLSCLHEKHF